VPSGLGELHLPLQAPVPRKKIRRDQREKCLSANAGSYLLNALAALSRRPSDHACTLNNDADEEPGFLGRPATSATVLDAVPLYPSFKPRKRIQHISFTSLPWSKTPRQHVNWLPY
jgi:hypothetical protein